MNCPQCQKPDTRVTKTMDVNDAVHRLRSCAPCGHRFKTIEKSPRPAQTEQPVRPALRFSVLKRDGFKCVYCGAGPHSGVELHVDHLVPRAQGGSNDDDNLVTACASCNGGKGALPL